ncbi:hypothetical protein Trydic_g14589 [Trypoxylus dichotomus]
MTFHLLHNPGKHSEARRTTTQHNQTTRQSRRTATAEQEVKEEEGNKVTRRKWLAAFCAAEPWEPVSVAIKRGEGRSARPEDHSHASSLSIARMLAYSRRLRFFPIFPSNNKSRMSNDIRALFTGVRMFRNCARAIFIVSKPHRRKR